MRPTREQLDTAIEAAQRRQGGLVMDALGHGDPSWINDAPGPVKAAWRSRVDVILTEALLADAWRLRVESLIQWRDSILPEFPPGQDVIKEAYRRVALGVSPLPSRARDHLSTLVEALKYERLDPELDMLVKEARVFLGQADPIPVPSFPAVEVGQTWVHDFYVGGNPLTIDSVEEAEVVYSSKTQTYQAPLHRVQAMFKDAGWRLESLKPSGPRRIPDDKLEFARRTIAWLRAQDQKHPHPSRNSEEELDQLWGYNVWMGCEPEVWANMLEREVDRVLDRG